MSKDKFKKCLTNEYITKYYKNNFTLALDVIERARKIVNSGKEFNLQDLLEKMSDECANKKESIE